MDSYEKARADHEAWLKQNAAATHHVNSPSNCNAAPGIYGKY